MYKVFEYSEGSNSLRWVFSWLVFFFFKQKTAYEMRISDWSSDVCSSDLLIKDELLADAKKFGDDRRSPLVAREAAQALAETDLVASEPMTIVLSEKGWVRAAKGHDVDAATLSYRDSSEERRVGDEGVSTCRSRWSQEH